MNYKDYFKKLEENAKYQKVEKELKTLLDLADDVLRLRMEKGWSQAQLAERVGTKQANISRLESGLSNPSINFLQKVAKALDTSIFINFENANLKYNFSTDTENQSQTAIPAPNWPTKKIYTSYDVRRLNGS